ncbi:YegS/Rv2252/BmrU family lipid kinase [Orenia marismortui]|uniref:YegS/Rv2252/BmrU family lipid kinase n=1 Tax=Orenia marismortui TaxID=46469 RepID=A0A4R8H7T9_9FIRM|nr:YegS/Rv2252/BmrU family lipid kinase [Orenia marismortui]TDX51628.1 YegS/Rv2252/BmrU family lipid kinase [Orenia marismortui]
MKKVKLIYNPMSGNKKFPNFLDSFIKKFQDSEYEVSIFRTCANGNISLALEGVDKADYDAIVVAGGDGSVNEVVNEMIKHDLDLPLGIIPAGTANDFANNLNMPTDFNKCFEVILKNNIQKVDVGEVNGRYFINVCAGGLLSSVSHNIDRNFKNTLGKMAYYIKGIEQIPKLKAIPLEIQTKKEIIKEDVYLFMILNSKSAGGFNKLAPKAAIDDGMFEFIAVKSSPLHEIAALFLKILQGDHLNDKNIIYLRDDYFKIKCSDHTYDLHFSDVDGEKGPHLPLEVSLDHHKIKVFTNL